MPGRPFAPGKAISPRSLPWARPAGRLSGKRSKANPAKVNVSSYIGENLQTKIKSKVMTALLHLGIPPVAGKTRTCFIHQSASGGIGSLPRHTDSTRGFRRRQGVSQTRRSVRSQWGKFKISVISRLRQIQTAVQETIVRPAQWSTWADIVQQVQWLEEACSFGSCHRTDLIKNDFARLKIMR